MMHKRTVISVLLILALMLPSCRFGSHLEWYNGIEVLHLEGSPYERGAAYGHIMKKEIHETVSRWTAEVENTFGRDPDAVIEEFLASSNYRESIERHDPDLLDEVYGMSESARLDFATLLAFQMSEELFTLTEADKHMNCTSVGRSRTDSTVSILAQNMDPPLFLHGHPIVLHNIPDKGEPENFIFTVPGLLGLAGMNEKGIAVTCMGLSMLNHDTDGLPVVSVVRRILSSSTLEEALAFMHRVSFAIPQCYGIGGIEGVYCLECSANQVAEFYPFEEEDVLLHTNHSITNRDFSAGYLELLGEYGKTAEDPYYCPRFYLAYDKIREYEMDLGFEEIASILRAQEPEIEPILNDHTLGTLIMELDEDPVLRIALGHEPGAVFRNLHFR